MTRRAAFRQADASRLIKAAIAAGMAPGTFMVKVVAGELQLLPIAANSTLDPAEAAESRMVEAFGE